MKNGQIYNINFNGNIGSEINSTHLGIIYKIPKVRNMVFCIPLTSPKLKHFKSLDDYNKRNHSELKHQNLVYIDQADSIALLDQMRSISVNRLIKSYKNIILNEKNNQILIVKATKYLKNILKV